MWKNNRRVNSKTLRSENVIHQMINKRFVPKYGRTNWVAVQKRRDLGNLQLKTLKKKQTVELKGTVIMAVALFLCKWVWADSGVCVFRLR